jgi:serine/threonine protein phosphatase PrpC
MMELMNDHRSTEAWLDDALQRRISSFLGEVRGPKQFYTDKSVCLATSVGSVRNDNQDRAVVVRARDEQRPEQNFLLAVLSDGIGGLAHGGEAATLAISAFVARYLRTSRLNVVDRLRSAAINANALVYSRFKAGAGATLSAVIVTNDDVVNGVNVGDSRIYAISKQRELIQLSQDDTLAGVLRQVETPPEHYKQLVQFIGMGEGVEPHLLKYDLNIVDALLLTTDGVHSAPNGIMRQIVRRTNTLGEILRKLLSLSDLLGGQDNATAVAVLAPLSAEREPVDGGLTLTILSASHRLEVWVPPGSQERRQSVASVSESEMVQVAQAPERLKAERRTSPNTRESKRKKRRGSLEKRLGGKLAGEADLPLGDDAGTPVLDIKFPPST